MYEPTSDDYVEKFSTHAMQTALWSDTMPKSENGESGMDSTEANGFELSDMESESRETFVNVCRDFCEANSDDLRNIKPEQAGYHFWLTSQGHGAGFWDGDYPQEVGQRLTDAAKVYTFDGVSVEEGRVTIDY